MFEWESLTEETGSYEDNDQDAEAALRTPKELLALRRNSLGFCRPLRPVRGTGPAVAPNRL